MASIQDIHALEERIYDAVQEYLDNPDISMKTKWSTAQKWKTISKEQRMTASILLQTSSATENRTTTRRVTSLTVGSSSTKQQPLTIHKRPI